MDRLFGDFTSGQGQSPPHGCMGTAIEVAERDGKYLVQAELPALRPEDVKVEITDDALLVHGERKWEQESKEGGVQRGERRYGRFYRSIPLPEGIDPEQVKAKFQNGVLEVAYPYRSVGNGSGTTTGNSAAATAKA